MKRITKLNISNYRAFFESYEIELNKGQNLLIYGENGSGKSSFFKSLNNFLSSSRNTTLPFVKHHNNHSLQGILTFTFNDYDLASNSITSPVGSAISFGSEIVTTNLDQFVQTAELTKGFLDYKALLSVYNHTDARPNLFELIIDNLLKEFIPIHRGATDPLGRKFRVLQNQISTAHHRKSPAYINGVREMVAHETLLREVLDEVFVQLNAFLLLYFKLNLRIWYSLSPLVSTGSWRDIPTELRLDIKLNGVVIRHQSDFLNEARLSALAICLYLAVIKKNPQPIDFKVLFLDDVFIGLDLTNRLPILEIIKNEFADYQVFIGTYDRHLYELAKRKFEIEVPDKWKTIELYVGKDTIEGSPVDKTVLVAGETNFEKGSKYLHDRKKPDYPASANYFRKALEELVQRFTPPYETIEAENGNQIPDYKLGPLIGRLKRFLDKTGNSSNSLDRILTLLPALLHPLSHHEITSPVYRGELLTVENLIPKLIQELTALNILKNYQCSRLEGRNKIRLKFIISAATNHFSFYELKTSEALVLKRNPGQPLISGVRCHAEKVWGENNGAVVPRSRKEFSHDEKEHPDLNFLSLQDAYDRLHARMILIPAIGNFPKIANYLDAFEYLDVDGTFKPLNSVVVWK